MIVVIIILYYLIDAYELNWRKNNTVKKILVLGATGNVGNEIFKRLLNDGYNTIGTTKTIEKVKEKILFLQIEDDIKLSEYISKFDIIVNCIGPSYKYKNKVIKIANELGKDYIDIYGGHILEKELKETVNSVSIINAGCEPGVTGILPKKFSYNFTNGNARIDIISGGYELGGYAAFTDIILSSISGYNKNGYHIRNGNVFRADYKNIIKDKESYVLYLTKEIERLATKYDIENIYSYKINNGIVDEIIKNTCIELIKLENLDNASNIIYESYNKIKKILFKDEFFIKTEFFKDDKLKEKIELKCKNTSGLIAILISYLVKKIYHNKITNGGYWAFEVVDYDEFICTLLKNNNMVQISFLGNCVT